MTSSLGLQVLGYAASALIALSMAMRSIVRLRWINLIGAVCFTIYGALIEAYPVALLNLLIVGINVWFLVRSRRQNENFSVVTMSPDSPYVQEFLRFHAADIARFQPEFRHDASATTPVLVTLRDLVPAGMMIGHRHGETLEVALDYVAPQFRDFRVGDYLLNSRGDVFRTLGVSRLATSGGSPDHTRYLERMGFTNVGGRFSYDVTRQSS